MKGKRISRMLAIMLVFMMVFTLIPGTALAGSTVTDNNSSEDVTRDVYVSFQNVNSTTGVKQFELPKTKITVSSNLAEEYGYKDKISPSEHVSALDVLVAVVKRLKGDNGVKDNLSLGSSGYVTLFGSNLFSFAVDGFYPSDGIEASYGYTGSTVDTTIVNDNQYIEMFMYDKTYTDDYSWFEKDGKKLDRIYVKKGESLTLNLKGYGYAYNGGKPLASLADCTFGFKGVNIFSLGENIFSNIKTGDNGVVSLPFMETGKYIVSAQTNTTAGPRHNECSHIILTMDNFYDYMEDWMENSEKYCTFSMNMLNAESEASALEGCECSCCGARLEELSQIGDNYSGKLIMPTLEVEVVESLTNEMKAANIAEDLDWTVIAGENDIFYNVTKNLNLVTSYEGATITWETSDSEIISPDGKVTIPEPYNGNRYVTLTANVNIGDAHASRNYYINVYEPEPPVKILTDNEQNNIIDKVLSSFKIDNKNGQELLYSDYFRDFIPAAIKNGESLNINQKNSVINRVIIDAQSNMSSSILGSLAKDVLVLTSLGIDASKLIVEGTSINLLEKIYSAGMDNLTIYNAPYVLLAYRCNDNYIIPSGAKLSEDEVINYILKNQVLDTNNSNFGAWGYTGWENAGDTASVMLGLSDYISYNSEKVGNGKIRDSLQQAENYIINSQPISADFGGANYNSYIILNECFYNNDAREKTYGEEYPDVIDALLSDRITSGSDIYWFKNYTGSKDVYSTADAYRALVSFRLYNNKGNGKIYDFSDKQLQPLTVETVQKRLTGVFVKTPNKIKYKLGETADYTGMTVTAKYNNRDTEILNESGYSVLGFDTTSVGTKTITVKVQQILEDEVITQTGSFTINVSEAEGTTPELNTVTTTVKNADGTVIASGNTTINKGVTNVLDVLKTVLANAGLTATIKNGNYVASIDNLSEFDMGGNSGWMYSVNGYTPPTTSANQYILKGGENIVWYYTKDYTKEPGVMVPENQSSVTTSGTAGSATTTTPTEVTVSGDTAKATIKTENAAEAIKQAKEKKSAEIVIEVANADIKTAEKVQVELPTATAKEILNTTTADLTVKTPIGTVTVPRDTLKEAVAEAKGTTITVEVAAVSKPNDTQKKAAGTNGQIISVTIKSGSTVISTFGGKSLKLKSEVPAKLKGKNIAAIHIAADGTIEQLTGKLVKEGTKEFYEFMTTHLSTFALVDADELGLEVNDEEANIEAVKKLVSGMTLKASSSKTSRKNIKVALTVDKDTAAAIKEIKDMGYTVKYKYYRSTRKASKYQAKTTKTTRSFTNTAGKKGTKYYYKARIQVYDKDGKLVAQTALKQCRYAARTWTK